MSKRQLVLHLLTVAGPRGVTTGEFLEACCGSRFGARVQELREAGWIVETTRIRDGDYRYVLRHSPEPPPRPAPSPADLDAVELQLFELPTRQVDYRDAA